MFWLKAVYLYFSCMDSKPSSLASVSLWSLWLCWLLLSTALSAGEYLKEHTWILSMKFFFQGFTLQKALKIEISNQKIHFIASKILINIHFHNQSESSVSLTLVRTQKVELFLGCLSLIKWISWKVNLMFRKSRHHSHFAKDYRSAHGSHYIVNMWNGRAQHLPLKLLTCFAWLISVFNLFKAH